MATIEEQAKRMGITSQQLLQELADAEAAQPGMISERYLTYTTTNKDTIHTIASRYPTISAADIKDANPNLKSYTTGQKIKIPVPERVQYSVKKGDTLESFAKRYGMSVADLKAYNPGIEDKFKFVGNSMWVNLDKNVAPPTKAPPVNVTPDPGPFTPTTPSPTSTQSGGAAVNPEIAKQEAQRAALEKQIEQIQEALKKKALTPEQQALKVELERKIAETRAKIEEAQNKINTLRQAEQQGFPTGGHFEDAVDYLKGLKDVDLPDQAPEWMKDHATGDDRLDEMLLIMKQQLEEMTRRGQSVNPNIEITPEKTAEFMKQAEQEINPYYQTQLKMAREGFLSSLGYTRNEVIRFEEDLSKKFQTGHRQLGESAAEQGFALSGTRRRDEREMAEAAQRQAEDVRSRAAQQTEQGARQLASEWGSGAVEPLKWGEMPQFTPSGQVIGGSRELPAFQLGSAYTDLIGSKEFERRGTIKSRQAELEGAERERLLAGEMRKLTL